MDMKHMMSKVTNDIRETLREHDKHRRLIPDTNILLTPYVYADPAEDKALGFSQQPKKNSYVLCPLLTCIVEHNNDQELRMIMCNQFWTSIFSEWPVWVDTYWQFFAAQEPARQKLMTTVSGGWDKAPFGLVPTDDPNEKTTCKLCKHCVHYTEECQDDILKLLPNKRTEIDVAIQSYWGPFERQKNDTLSQRTESDDSFNAGAS
jgi:hypothetical protein